MPTSHYDLIVLGDDFSGLVAATLCARRGMRVLLATSGEAPTSYSLDSYRLPVEPLPLASLTSPATQRVLDELHFHHLLKRKLRHPQPPFQLIGPDIRLAMGSDDAALAKEIERELISGRVGADGALLSWCEHADRAAAYLDTVFQSDASVPPTGFWGKREIGRTAERATGEANAWDESLEGDLCRALTGLCAAFGTHAAPDNLSPVARSRALATWRQGVPRLPGDWETLRAIFTDKFVSHNGEMREVHVSSLMTSWGKVTGIRLEDGEELGASHVIAAMPADELAPLTEGKILKKVSEVSSRFEVGAYRYTLNLVLEGVGVPEGMTDNVLVIHDPSLPIENGNGLAIYLDPPDGEARVAVSVQAICPAPAGNIDELDDALASLRVLVRERLEDVMPFYAGHVRIAHSPHESSAPEGLSAAPEREILAEPRPLWRTHGDQILGVAGATYQLGIKQLTLGSSQVLPGLGLEGDMAVGWFAAGIACEASGKKKDYLKSEAVSR